MLSSTIPIRCFFGLTLYHPNRPQPRYFFRQPRAMDDLDDVVHVFVRRRLFFGEAFPTAGFGDDALLQKFAVDAAALRGFHRSGAAHHAAGAVAGAAEGLFHAARLPGKNPTGAAHIAGYQDWLPDGLKLLRHFGMARWKRAGRALAMHPNAFADAVDF